MRPRILLALPQMPQDPASGAARSMRTACEMACQGGFEVRAIATTATERGTAFDPLTFLREDGHTVSVLAPSSRNFRELRFEQRGIAYTLLDTGISGPLAWESVYGRQFDRLFEQELKQFHPDILFTYGGSAGDQRRMRRARQSGARVVFGLRNLSYFDPRFFDDIDAILTPSEFVTRRYRETLHIESTSLPTPIDPEDVIAADREPIFVTIVNPSPEKGLMFFARLAEELGSRYPEIAVLAIESRGTAGMVTHAGRAGGFDLRRHESIMIAEAAARPRDIFQTARVLLGPSVWEEPAGRVVAEALLNGVPPLVSDRGGLPEMCDGAGFVLPLPSDYEVGTNRPVGPESVEPWVELIERLAFDEEFYEGQSSCARAAGRRFTYEALAPKYVAYFENLL